MKTTVSVRIPLEIYYHLQKFDLKIRYIIVTKFIKQLNNLLDL